MKKGMRKALQYYAFLSSENAQEQPDKSAGKLWLALSENSGHCIQVRIAQTILQSCLTSVFGVKERNLHSNSVGTSHALRGQDWLKAPTSTIGWVKENNYRGHGDSVDQLCWHPTNPDVFVTASGDKTIRIWDVRTAKCTATVNTKGEKLWEVQCESPTFTVAWHPKRPLLAYACDDKEGK
ncbi:pre-mRNA 3' end processing protein pfs-2-like [Salvelinus alpinus]